MASRFASRARARRKARIPSRSERRAKAPREPRGPTLRYQLAMRQLGGAFESAVKAVVLPELERFAGDGAPSSAAKSIAAKLRARLKGTPRKLAGAIAAVGKATVAHTGTEFKRLGIKPRKARRQTRTDAADGDPRPYRERPTGIKLRDEDAKFGPLIDRWRVENVDKITSLVGHEIDVIEGMLRDGEGRRVESLRKDIEERFEVTRSKADLLARDQVLKLNAQITQERQTAAGVEEYVWTTSNDERVRPMHDALEGRKFQWDDPPVTNEAGDRNHPGLDFQCRCTAFPVLSELDEELFDVAAE